MMKYASYAQLGQDVFVCERLDWKQNGYFVEIGAGNGKLISNTYLLEKKLNWTGLLCEANRYNCYSILDLRTAALEMQPIWKNSGKIVRYHNDIICENSGIEECFNETREDRRMKSIDELTTLSLNYALERHKCPTEIDYISIDTEGSELDILSTFDFEKYKVKIWSIEHNTPWRKDGEQYLQNIRNIMEPAGYTFVSNEFDSYFLDQELTKSY